MAFSTKLNLSNSKFEQSGASELLFEGTNNFTGTVNFSGATQMTADGSTFLIDGLAFSTYTGDTTTAANGLSVQGDNIVLGGTLTGNTEIISYSATRFSIFSGNTVAGANIFVLFVCSSFEYCTYLL